MGDPCCVRVLVWVEQLVSTSSYDVFFFFCFVLGYGLLLGSPCREGACCTRAVWDEHLFSDKYLFVGVQLVSKMSGDCAL